MNEKKENIIVKKPYSFALEIISLANVHEAQQVNQRRFLFINF
jgi:hypothetical protein